MPACSVNGCKKCSKTSNLEKDGITFHRFPLNIYQRLKWTEACNRANEWLPKPSSSICSRHFEATQFQLTGRRQLIKDAMPTLLLQRYELEMANLDTTWKQVILGVPNKSQHTSLVVHETAEVWTEDEITTTNSEMKSDTHEVKQENPEEQLPPIISQLLPNLKDDNAIFIVLVNNERSSQKLGPNGTDVLPKLDNAESEGRRKEALLKMDQEREIQILRKKLASITQVAEDRARKLHAAKESRIRLLKRNWILKNIILKLKRENLLNQKNIHG